MRVSSYPNKTLASVVGVDASGNVGLAAPYILKVRGLQAYYGAVGGDQTKDTAALVAAINSGLSFEVEDGRYLITADAAPRMNFGQHIFGRGRPPQGFGGTAGSGLQKVGNGKLLNFVGGSTTDRVEHAGLSNIGLFGDGSTGSLLAATYASNMVADNVMFYGNPDTTLDMVEVWDSNFLNPHFFHCGGSGTYQTKSVIRVSGSATDSSNRINFWGLRCETFPGHGLFFDDGGVAAHSPYQINFYAPKFESTIRSGLAFVTTKNTVSAISFRDAYFASDALGAGGSAGPIVEVVGAQDWLFDNTRASCSGNSATSLFQIWSSGFNEFRKVSINDVTALSAGVFAFTSGGTSPETGSKARMVHVIGSSAAFSGAQPSGFVFEA